MPGACYPEDFNMNKGINLLLEAIQSGKYCIDWWEGDAREGKNELEQTYYIRPVTKGNEGKLYDASWGGECIFLTSNGCKLLHDKRPHNCRMLEPNKDDCIQHGKGKSGSAIAWLDYTDILESLEESIK